MNKQKIWQIVISSDVMKTINHYLVDINQYETLNSMNPINRGTFGQIYLVEHKCSKAKLAAKVLVTANAEEKYIVREIAILIQMQALTIIPFSGFSLKDIHGNANITILMPYQENGSLSQLIDKEN